MRIQGGWKLTWTKVEGIECMWRIDGIHAEAKGEPLQMWLWMLDMGVDSPG